MLALTKILKRKDASSVVVAVVAALVITGLLQAVTQQPAELLSGIESGNPLDTSGNSTFQQNYLFPTVLTILQFVALELLARLVIFVNGFVTKKK